MPLYTTKQVGSTTRELNRQRVGSAIPPTPHKSIRRNSMKDICVDEVLFGKKDAEISRGIKTNVVKVFTKCPICGCKSFIFVGCKGCLYEIK